MSTSYNFILRWDIATSTLANGRAISAPWTVNGFKWGATITKRGYGADYTLTCESLNSGQWKCATAVVEVSVLSANRGLDLGEKIYAKFNKDSTRVLIIECHYWPYFMDPAQYNIDGTATIQFQISNFTGGECEDKPNIDAVDLSLFHSPIETSNVTLVLGDKKFVVSKEFLAIHSPVFNTTFFGKFMENGKEEVELQEVDYEDFISLLLVIFPGKIDISYATVLPIIKLADRFQIERAIDLAEKYIIATMKFSNSEKMQLAEEYRLNKLRDHCEVSCEKVDEMKVFMSTSED